ncbi:RNA polymerase sigma factor [Parapedobacter composti]|nr:sigma-70 family RNA polymerase sigma factor [Parapedobacter composti]
MQKKKNHIHSSEEELVSLLREGDESAFSAIYERYWQVLYNSAFKRLSNRQLSTDVVQEVFCDLWTRRHTLEIRNLTTYLFHAVKYQVYKTARKDKSALHFFEKFDHLCSAPKTDTLVLEKELFHRFQVWQATLPASRRRIFEMRYEEDMPVSEIARVLGISPKTVQNQLSLLHVDLKTKMLSLFLLFLLTSL